MKSKPLSFCSLIVLVFFGGMAVLRGQSDNFNSGTLSASWATSICSNFPGTITFPADPYGGKAIRMVANYSAVVTGDPVQDSTGQNNPRLIAWRTDRQYTNFYVAVDVLAWNTFNQNRATNTPLIALFSRLREVGRDPAVPVGRSDCMVLYLNYNRFGGQNINDIGGTRGVVNLGHLKDGGQASVFNTLGVQGEFTLDPRRTYRVVFTGTNFSDGSSIYFGRVYDRQDLTCPLVTVKCPDPMPGFDSESPWTAPGYSGFGVVSDGATKAADVTFDNFVAAEYPPSGVGFPGTTNGEAGLPQVINRTPASWTNFYSAAGGINFTATTLEGSAVTSVKLFLNGVDLTSRLTVGPQSNSRAVSLPGSILTSNMVYDARIELANALGQQTTNVWTFDTFSDAFLASTNLCKVVECEDFDFGGGQFIDNPVPSGWTTNVTYYNNIQSEPFPWSAAINSDTGVPPYTSYVNKGTPETDYGIDYWDVDGKNTQPYESDYRPLFNNSVSHTRCPGTAQGLPGYMVVDYTGNWFPGNFGQNMMRVFDTQRAKYSQIDPALQEYLLERIEGGEWYNYTRQFESTNYYNVYLRAGSEYDLQVNLSRITGSATNKLGEFFAPQSVASYNLRYLPLVVSATPPASLIRNGNFIMNASSFTSAPGYAGGANPASIPYWTDVYSQGGYGLNGSETAAGYAFSPANGGGLTFAFLQNGNTATGHVLAQYLTNLVPNTTYQLVYSVGGRLGNNARYRVVLYADNARTTAYYDSGAQSADMAKFVNVSATFTTPANLGGAPHLQIGNWSEEGDNTVDFANVFLVPVGSPVTASKPAIVNFSGATKLRLLMDFAQQERTKQGLALNYLAFVPALLVESSAEPAFGYTIDNSAVIEPVTRTITLPRTADSRFYRLRWDHAGRITNLTLTAENVILTYE